MVALRPRRAALPNAAESATVPAGCARGNLPIAHSLGSGLGGWRREPAPVAEAPRGCRFWRTLPR